MLSQLLFSKHLEDDETLRKVVHKHWLVGIRALFWPTVFFLGIVFILAMQPARGIVTVLSVLSVVILVWWLRNFFDYYLDAWLVTDQGIIDIAWHGWFHRQSTRTLYSDLQGVSYEIVGIPATLFRYGTIEIEKVSSGQTISLDYVHNPKKVESLVVASQEVYLHSKNMKDSKQIQKLLSALVAEQIQLQDLKGDSAEDVDE